MPKNLGLVFRIQSEGWTLGLAFGYILQLLKAEGLDIALYYTLNTRQFDQ